MEGQLLRPLQGLIGDDQTSVVEVGAGGLMISQLNDSTDRELFYNVTAYRGLAEGESDMF